MGKRATLLTLAALLLVLSGVTPPAQAFILWQPPTLSEVCKMAKQIAVLRVEKINREKNGIVYRKVRDLKGTFPGDKEYEGAHILRKSPSQGPGDAAIQDQLNEMVLALAAEGKTAVMFVNGTIASVCVGQAWYTINLTNDRVLICGSDSRFSRVYCGDVDELISAVTDLVAGKEVTVPRMVGSHQMLNDRTAPIRRRPANKVDPDKGGYTPWGNYDYQSPFRDQAPWGTHRGNPQRTGTDDEPGPKNPNVLWVHRSDNHFVAPLVPGSRDLYASSLGAFNTSSFHALSLDPAGQKQLRWTKGAPFLRLPIAGAPALVRGPTDMLVLGDGFHTDEGSSLRCLRAADGFPLWQLPMAGKLVHCEGTPTYVGEGGFPSAAGAARKLYVGAGNAGVLCLEPGRVTLEGKEQELVQAQTALDQRWKELLAKYQVEKKKDPEFAVPPDESMLPRPVPKRIWQQGQDRWHVDAPVAVVEERVLAASAYLDDEKEGERALVCLKVSDGAILWKTPLKLNPWAGPTVGPYALVGCSSIRLDPKAVAGAKGEVVAIELDTGKVKWRKEVPGGVLSSVAVKAGLAIFTATDGKVRAWGVFTGREQWSYDAQAPFFAGPAVAQNTVYAADLQGVVHALNLADGKKEWTLDLGANPATKTKGMVYGSPVVHAGRLYLATCNLGDTREKAPNMVVCVGDKGRRQIPLDLQPHATQKLKDNFNRPGNNLAGLATGEQTLAGVKWKIGDGLLSGQATKDKHVFFSGIRVGMKVSKLHFLQATHGQAPEGTNVGYYLVHYEYVPPTPTHQGIPLIYGKNISDWWHRDNSAAPSGAKLAWQSENDATRKTGGSKIGLYMSTWNNPDPSRKVINIEFVSTVSEAAPFCVAITAEE